MAETTSIISLPPLSGGSGAPPSMPLHGEQGEGVLRLRAEIAATEDRTRQARLLNEVADLLERHGDEPSAAREYLAAFNADPTFREPLEALVRLMERRRSLKNLGKVIDAMVRVSVSAEEKIRALTMRAAFLEDVGNEPEGAREALREATELEGSDEDVVAAWLSLELLAAKLDDPMLRKQALAERTRRASDPTWQGLLLIDLARLTAGQDGSGDVAAALSLLDEARSKGAGATYLAALATEQLASVTSTDREVNADAYASALEAQADLIERALGDASVGDTFGVPRAVRSAARLADLCMRAAEVRRLSGDLPRAAQILDRGLSLLDGPDDKHEGLLPFLFAARIRVAELSGDTELAAKLALRRLEKVKDGPIAASFAMRVAEQAASIGDAKGALEAVSKAVDADPECLPARALQLDLLADGADPAAFASQLETFADCLPTEAARAHAFVLAAYVWGVQADDAPAAKAALAEARMLGIGENVLWRVARMVALLRGDTGWADDVARRLLKGGTDARDDSQATADPMHAAPDDSELSYLWVGVLRSKIAAGDDEGLASALKELADAPDGAWLAHTLEAFLPTEGNEDVRGRALERLADLEQDPKLARGLSLLAAVRTHEAGDMRGARERLRALAAKDPSDPVIATYLAELERKDGAHSRAALTLTACAMATKDRELAAALHLEAGFSRWRAGERAAALDAFQHAAEDVSTLRGALSWAARGTDTQALEGKRRAIHFAERSDKDGPVVALERFATEAQAGDVERAALALTLLEDDAQGDIALAAALARLTWPPADNDGTRVDAAISRIALTGVGGNQLAAAEQWRRARSSDPHAAMEAAQRWFDAGGGLSAAFEWVVAATAAGAPSRESDARRALAGTIHGPAREAMLAGAAMLDGVTGHGDKTPLLSGESVATRLANLDIAPPGCDPRRRAFALRSLAGALGEDATSDAESMAGWSLLISGDPQAARRSFNAAVAARPGDLAAWEGLRAAAAEQGDRKVVARATMELGMRVNSDARGAALLEEAGKLLLELGEERLAEVAFDKAFARDGDRVFAFDKVFRSARARKDGQKLLALVSRRLDISEDPTELAKLFWEQARALRENGDIEGALKALENVTMFEPEHVGALALSGEIFIRRGMYEEAAENLAKLATIEDAPPKNRVTAGIAAVDLYENKLDRYDRALEVLSGLHRAGLSTLPVRERLARAAARTGSWREATSILEVLMNERPDPTGRVEAARLAMAIHRDRLGQAHMAVPAIVKLLEEQPTDGEAIDFALAVDFDPETKQKLLQYVGEALCDLVRTHPVDGPALRRLGRIAHAVGDTEVEHVALSAAQVVAGPEPAEEAILQSLLIRKPRVPQMAMPEALRAVVAAPGDDGPIAALFRVLAPTLAEALGPSLSALGVTKKDKVDPRSGLALRNEIATWAGAFGVAAFDLYVGGKEATGVHGIPGEMPALVVGPGVTSPLAPAIRARVASELYALARGSTIVRSRDATSVAAIVVAACHLVDVAIEAPPFAVLAEFERSIGKAIARRTKKLLPELCQAVVASHEDARTWYMRAQLSLARCAMVASGDVPSVLCDLMGEPLANVRANVARDERAVELLKFALSASYLEIRRALGLEGLS